MVGSEQQPLHQELSVPVLLGWAGAGRLGVPPAPAQLYPGTHLTCGTP